MEDFETGDAWIILDQSRDLLTGHEFQGRNVQIGDQRQGDAGILVMEMEVAFLGSLFGLCLPFVIP